MKFRPGMLAICKYPGGTGYCERCGRVALIHHVVSSDDYGYNEDSKIVSLALVPCANQRERWRGEADIHVSFLEHIEYVEHIDIHEDAE